MKKQATTNKTAKEQPHYLSDDFLTRFYDGKINYRLPAKYPENFAVCQSFFDGKREIPFAHREKVSAILRDSYNILKPIVKKFRISLALLVEQSTTQKGVAWTNRIKLDFSTPGFQGKRGEDVQAFTSMIQIMIRNKENPQNSKKFLNKTTILAILLHELAHTRHMHHGIKFAKFLKEIYEYAMVLGIFPQNEEMMIPSSRPWERRMFETKGRMSIAELEEFFGITSKKDEESEEDEHEEHDHWHPPHEEEHEHEHEEEQNEEEAVEATLVEEEQKICEDHKESSERTEAKDSEEDVREKKEEDQEKEIKAVEVEKEKVEEKTKDNEKEKVKEKVKTKVKEKEKKPKERKKKDEKENKKETPTLNSESRNRARSLRPVKLEKLDTKGEDRVKIRKTVQTGVPKMKLNPMAKEKSPTIFKKDKEKVLLPRIRGAVAEVEKNNMAFERNARATLEPLKK